jgi:hypothetical protein
MWNVDPMWFVFALPGVCADGGGEGLDVSQEQLL